MITYDRVRVANELGAGNGNAAKFATIVSLVQSTVIGAVICVVIMIFHDKIAFIFTDSSSVVGAVDTLSSLLAVTILLNSIQPVLSGFDTCLFETTLQIQFLFLLLIWVLIYIYAGVAVGSGWQSWVAYINIGCYYLIGLPLGFVMEWVFHSGVLVCFFIRNLL